MVLQNQWNWWSPWVPAFTSSAGLRWLCSLASKIMLMIHWYTLITTWQCTLLVKLQRLFFFHWMLKIFAGVLAQHRELSLYCLMIHRKTMIRNLRMELNRSDQVYSDVGNLIKFYCQLFRNKILRSDPMRRNLLWRGFWRLTDHTDHFF